MVYVRRITKSTKIRLNECVGRSRYYFDIPFSKSGDSIDLQNPDAYCNGIFIECISFFVSDCVNTKGKLCVADFPILTHIPLRYENESWFFTNVHLKFKVSRPCKPNRLDKFFASLNNPKSIIVIMGIDLCIRNDTIYTRSAEVKKAIAVYPDRNIFIRAKPRNFSISVFSTPESKDLKTKHQRYYTEESSIIT